MNLKSGELRVHYNVCWGVDVLLDRALEKVLKKFGYERWASGCDLTNGVRDLAFQPIKEEINEETVEEEEALITHGTLAAQYGDPRDEGFRIG